MSPNEGVGWEQLTKIMQDVGGQVISLLLNIFDTYSLLTLPPVINIDQSLSKNVVRLVDIIN